MILKDLLFPKVCLNCGYLGAYICSGCEKKLKYIDQDLCVYCGKASHYGFTHPGCRRSYGLDGVLSLYYYNVPLQRIIKGIKYRLATDIWKEFCLILKPKILEKMAFYKSISKNIVLQPIPLHKNKLKLRGFNQAMLISEFIASNTGLKIIRNLEKVKVTHLQAQLKTRKERYDNIKGSFIVPADNRINDEQVVLVDDVITTGFTIKEASKAFKRAGIQKVYALTIARG